MAIIQRAKGAVQIAGAAGTAGRAKGAVQITGAAGAVISSHPTTVARGETGVIIGIVGASASQGSATITYGGESCTITTYPGTSGNLLITIPSDIDLLYKEETYSFVYTDDDTSTDTSNSTADFTPATGRQFIDLVSPVYSDDAYACYNYEGTPAPVTGDQIEINETTDSESIPITVLPDSAVTLDSMPTVQNTYDVQLLRAATGVRSATWTVTLTVDEDTVSIGDRRRNHNIPYSHMTHSMFNKYK